MFTGIIEEIGVVVSLEIQDGVELWDGSKGSGYVLVIRCKTALEDAYIGCSIAVNGVCLTATVITSDTFTAHIAPETLRRTNLGSLKPGDGVDLERSATASTRVSGHFVQGHVDCPAAVVSKSKDGKDALTVVVELPEEYASLMRFIVSKGYVAVDGASLTVVSVDPAERTFSFMLIPHTQGAVVIPRRSIGEFVNIEVDCLGKYAAAAVDAAKAHGPTSSGGADTATAISVAFAALGVAVVALGLAGFAAWQSRAHRS